MMKYPLENALEKYLDPAIPARGAEEEELDPPMRPQGDGCDPSLPGNGLAEHDMIYVGEGLNRIFLVKDGKVTWTYDTGAGWELDDMWMLSNGNILFTRMFWAAEVTPDKKVVWRYDAPKGTEIHCIQPLGTDRIAFLLNKEFEPHLMIVDRATGKCETDKVIPYWGAGGSHGQTRHFRVTADGTYLVAYLTGRRVSEFDQDLNEIWFYETRQPWSAVRLKNGNTLIFDEAEQKAIEVNRDKEIVWSLSVAELGEYRMEGTQSCLRLDNGNTILCARGDNGKTAQAVEVTPDKKVVWVLKDWKNLGPCTSVQILTESGVPENPGECQR